MFCAAQYGSTPVRSRNKLLTTIAYQMAGKRTYALEGAIFIASAAVQWLRDGPSSSPKLRTSTSSRARSIGGAGMMPAFVGLGAPYWDADARGAIFDPRAIRYAEIACAVIESIGYQTRDLLEAMRRWPWRQMRHRAARRQRHDRKRSHAAVSRRYSCCARRPSVVMETTALGAAYLAICDGIYPDPAHSPQAGASTAAGATARRRNPCTQVGGLARCYTAYARLRCNRGYPR